MYNSFYGLSFNPFDKQQIKEKDHFVSNNFREMTNRLNYLKDIRGIGVFTARPGMGKSFCLRCFAASLNPSLFHMEYLCLSTIIDPAALAAAHSFTQGNPRLIDNLMTDALTIGSHHDQKSRDAESIHSTPDNHALNR